MDAGNEADPARVVFGVRLIQPLRNETTADSHTHCSYCPCSFLFPAERRPVRGCRAVAPRETWDSSDDCAPADGACVTSPSSNCVRSKRVEKTTMVSVRCTPRIELSLLRRASS